MVETVCLSNCKNKLPNFNLYCVYIMSTFLGHYALILSAVFNLLKNLAANVSSFGCSYIIILLSINHATWRKNMVNGLSTRVSVIMSSVIVQVRVVFKKTVVGDWRFHYLSGSHLQSQVKSRCQMMVFMRLAVVWIGHYNIVVMWLVAKTWKLQWLVGCKLFCFLKTTLTRTITLNGKNVFLAWSYEWW